MTPPNPNALVIDAGVGYALCTHDTTSTMLRAQIAFVAEQGVGLFAPSIWSFEVTSILAKAVSLQQLSEASARQALQLSGELRIQLVPLDQELVAEAFDWTLRLKRTSANDSFYLALAQRLGCDLWTMDQRLVQAVDASWIHYVGNAK